MFDVDGDGFIQPMELMHVMNVLGEELDHAELAEMMAECKAWGQPARGIWTWLDGTRPVGGQSAASFLASLSR